MTANKSYFNKPMRSGRMLNVLVDLLGLRAYVDLEVYDGWEDACSGGRPLPERAHAIHLEIAEAALRRFEIPEQHRPSNQKLAFSLRMQLRAWDMLYAQHETRRTVDDGVEADRPFPTLPALGLLGELIAALITLRTLEPPEDLTIYNPLNGAESRKAFLEKVIPADALEKAKVNKKTKVRIAECMAPIAHGSLEELAIAATAHTKDEDHRSRYADLLGYHALWRMSRELFDHLGAFELTVQQAALEYWLKLWLGLINAEQNPPDVRKRLALLMFMWGWNPIRKGLALATVETRVPAPLAEQTAIYLSFTKLWEGLLPGGMPEGYESASVEDKDRADANMLAMGLEKVFTSWTSPLVATMTDKALGPSAAYAIGVVSTVLLRDGAEKAEALAKEAFKRHPDAWQTRYALATIYLQTERPEEALALCELELEDPKERAQLIEIQARAKWALGERDAAGRLIRQAAKLDPAQAAFPDLESRWSNQVATEKAQAGRRGGKAREAFIKARKKAELAFYLGSPTAAAVRLPAKDEPPESGE
jgi:tetratricopeptide (TPR) repeat protein